MEENSKFMQEQRSKVDFGVKNLDKIEAFEMQLKAAGTPMSKFYETFKNVKEAEQAKKLKKAADKDYDFIPSMKPKKAKGSSEEFKGIFGDPEEESDEDEMDDVERFQLKEDRGKKRKKDESESEGEEEEEEEEEEGEEEEQEDNHEEEDDESDEDDQGDEDDVVKDFDGFESDDD